MSQVLLRHQLGLLYTKEEKSLRIGHNTREGCRLSDQVPSGPIFSPSAVNQSRYWWLCHIQCWAPPYLPEDFRYPGRKYVSALLETTDMDTALRSVSLPMERSTHTWLILVGRMGLAACLWFRIGLNLPSFLSD